MPPPDEIAAICKHLTSIGNWLAARQSGISAAPETQAVVNAGFTIVTERGRLRELIRRLEQSNKQATPPP